MIFKTPQARFLLRSAVMTIIAGVVVAGTIWIDNPYVKVAAAMAAALGGYMTTGASVGAVEPFVGKKYEDAEVPSPPADPEPPDNG